MLGGEVVEALASGQVDELEGRVDRPADRRTRPFPAPGALGHRPIVLDRHVVGAVSFAGKLGQGGGGEEPRPTFALEAGAGGYSGLAVAGSGCRCLAPVMAPASASVAGRPNATTCTAGDVVGGGLRRARNEGRAWV